MASKAKGYTAVAVPLPGSTGAFSYSFVKEHKEAGGGAGRTLFVVNVDDEGERPCRA
jgi:hypothetical protein